MGERLDTTGLTYFWGKIKSYISGKIVDNLTSTSATDALSANQGKVLNDLITDQFHGLKFNPLGSYTGAVHEINIPSGSRHFVMQISTSGGSYGYAAMIAVTSNGTIVNSDFFKDSNVTMTKSANKLTLTYSSSIGAYFYDFVLSGGSASRVTQ